MNTTFSLGHANTAAVKPGVTDFAEDAFLVGLDGASANSTGELPLSSWTGV